MVLDEFCMLNAKLLVEFYWGPHFGFHSKPNYLGCNIFFAKHDMQLACFRRSAGECVLAIERARFLEQACRSVMV